MRMWRLLALLICALSVFAQTDANKGQIIGTIYDPNQAVIAGAAVKIRNTGTGLTRDLTSNEVGQYRAVALDPGRYEITVTKAGFSTTTMTDIVLNVGASAGVDVVMQVGSTTQTIEVGESMVNIALPAPQTLVNAAAIATLPINGRRFQEFAVLTPTVQVEPQRQQLSFVGQRGINSNVMLDGADFNQPFFGGLRGGERSNFSFTVPQSAIAEFQVISSGYAAEYGRSSGGVLNAITKSGANEYHGEGFYLLRHKELGLKNPFNVGSLETQHQFGGAIGGPIKRDKLFFFGAVERQDSKTPRRVFFSQLGALPETANNREAIQYLRGLQEDYRQTNKASALTGKLDYSFRQADRLSFRYNHKRSNELNAVSVGGGLNPRRRGRCRTTATKATTCTWGAYSTRRCSARRW